MIPYGCTHVVPEQMVVFTVDGPTRAQRARQAAVGVFLNWILPAVLFGLAALFWVPSYP